MMPAPASLRLVSDASTTNPHWSLQQSEECCWHPMTQAVETMATPSGNPPQPPARRRCPDCGQHLLKRTSTSLHLLMSETFLVCKNVFCGATFKGIDEITHRISPPSIPNPSVNLPYTPYGLRKATLKLISEPSMTGADMPQHGS